MREGEQPGGAQGLEQAVAGRAVAVEVDGDVRGRAGPVEGAGDGPAGRGGGQQPVDGPGRLGDGGEVGGRGQHDVVAREAPPQRPQRGHPGEQVPQPERPQHEHPGDVIA